MPTEATFQPNPEAAFSALDVDVPLALFPVRLEARFFLDLSPPQLQLRVYPDAIHANAHTEALTEVEQLLGQTFWEYWWQAEAAGDTAADRQSEFWARLVQLLGPWRAAWVARALKPTNLHQATSVEGLNFPAVAPLTAPEPVKTALLPDRWAVIAYHQGERVGSVWWGADIPPDLPMAPALAGLDSSVNLDDVDAEAFLRLQGLSWMHDFDEAVAVGMGIRIFLHTLPGEVQRDGFSEIFVFGVRGGATDMQLELKTLLDAQLYTQGLDFVPQGTPTNNTDSVLTGWSIVPSDLDALLEREVINPPWAKWLRPTNPAALYRMRSADAAVVAFGIGGDSAINRVRQADNLELARARLMNLSLWPATLGQFFSSPLAGALPASELSWLRDAFANYVRGGGTLPVLQVGAQPYGLLPVSHITPDSNPNDNIAHMERVLKDLQPAWEAALRQVAYLDPDATDVSNNPGQGDVGEESAAVAQVLGAVPHPTDFRLRHVDYNLNGYRAHYQVLLVLLAVGFSNPPTRNGQRYANPETQSATRQVFDRLAADLDAAKTLADQIDAFLTAAGPRAFHRATSGSPPSLANLIQRQRRTQIQKDHDLALHGLIHNSILPFLSEHRDRIDPAMDLQLGGEVHDLIPNKTAPLPAPALFFSLFHDEGTEADWLADLVPREPSDLETLLEELLNTVSTPTTATTTSAQTNPPLSRYWKPYCGDPWRRWLQDRKCSCKRGFRVFSRW